MYDEDEIEESGFKSDDDEDELLDAPEGMTDLEEDIENRYH